MQLTKRARVKQVACKLYPDQHERLRELSRTTRVPQNVLLREAVDDLLTKQIAEAITGRRRQTKSEARRAR